MSIHPLIAESPSIAAGSGRVYLAGNLQGRIFASIDGELLHRFDAPLAENPAPDDFNNLGGNSLWPAPEGGDYAFNYPADGSPWRVQDGINKAVSQVSPDKKSMSRTITLENHRGKSAELIHRREVTAIAGFGAKYNLKEVVYSSCDSFEIPSPVPAGDFLVSAWSLEQFDLGGGAVSFGTLAPGAELNFDFYGDPAPHIDRLAGGFRFRMSGDDRLQIGIPENAGCSVIGTWIPEKDLLVLRRLRDADSGRRINFADNDQPDGVYSAADAYSIFYGATLGFFELETLAPVKFDAANRVTGSRMSTETHFYRGSKENMCTLLRECFNFDMTELE